MRNIAGAEIAGSVRWQTNNRDGVLDGGGCSVLHVAQQVMQCQLSMHVRSIYVQQHT